MKPKKINQQSVITNDVNSSPVIIKNKLQKNQKKKWLLLSIYILAFSITGLTTTMLLVHNHVNYSDSNFNPQSNSNLWAQYYENNKPDNELIDLTQTQNFFQDKTHQIDWQIKDVSDKNNLTFHTVLNQIDNYLKANKIETDGQVTSTLLPNEFFTNVINNPAVDFTVNNQQVTNNTFQWPIAYKQNTSYDLKVSTSNEANAFGIVNNNISFDIKVTITNLLTINLENLTLDNLQHNQMIYISNEESSNTTIAQITKYIQPAIKKAFVDKLISILKIKNIPDNDYNITFTDNDTNNHNFNKEQVRVNFQINSSDTAINDNFTGTFTSNVTVQNEVLDLNKEDELKTDIQNEYSAQEADHNKWLNIKIDNTNDKNNIDTCLTTTGVITSNNAISEAIKPIVVKDLNNKYKTLNLENDDIKITSNLKEGDNLFQNNDGIFGKQCTVTISRNKDNYKLSGKLLINITVHGTNFTSTTQNHNSPDNFKLNGIYLPDGQDNDILQDNEHYYQQTNLYENWMGENKDSLKNKLKNAYSIVDSSFTGQFTSQYQLETSGKTEQTTFNIDKINNQKISNFYDLIAKTKNIYLYTSVTKKSEPEKIDRVLNSVKLIFTNTIDPPEPNNDNILYSFDIITEKGISIKDNAKLMFDNFNFKISYQQNN